MKKILVFVCYFGKAPWYLDYFLQSCVDNQDVDFIFFTDIKEIEIKGDNMKIVPISFEDFRDKINSYFSFELNIQHPMKLCDIRTSFGEVFQDLIKDYDFWGYCDVDVVFGRIRYFLDDEVLENNDVIFTKTDYPTGFFAIYKNDITISSLYRSTPDYIKVFQNEKLLCFDECGGHYSQVCNGINILDTEYVIDSMHHILERNRDSVNVLYEFYSIEGTPGKIKYDNGVLIYKNEFEVLLYHMTSFKNNYYLKENILKKKELHDYFIGEFSFYKNKTLSVFYYKIYEKLFPYFKRMALRIDYLVSSTFKNNNKELIKEGEYKYMELSLFIYLKDNDLFLEFIGETPCKITPLSVFKNIFYLKELEQYYLIHNSSSISLILPEGNLINYTIQK